MSYTLVVVDMQATFEASTNANTVRNCKRLINKAIGDKAAIVFLEYSDYGESLPTLTVLTKGYKRVSHMIKHTNDGSNEAIEAIKKRRFAKSEVRVCGVNTDFCVLETVKGLSKQLTKSNIVVRSKSCNSNWSHQSGLDRMLKLPRVTVK